MRFAESWLCQTRVRGFLSRVGEIVCDSLTVETTYDTERKRVCTFHDGRGSRGPRGDGAPSSAMIQL